MDRTGVSSARVWDPEQRAWGHGLDLLPDVTCTVGREGDLVVGADDLGVSRVAVEVTATAHGWRIGIPNTNGGAIHPWGLAASITRHADLPWPRVAVRVEGQGAAYWVVLESTAYPFPDPRRPGDTGGSTRQVDPPLPLTARQEVVLRSFFRTQLSWPPVPGPPRQLKNVAHELDVSIVAVQNTLKRAQEKALRLGLGSSAGLTHPDYLAVLVQAGYLRPEDETGDDA